jgi:hypothetical protein
MDHRVERLSRDHFVERRLGAQVYAVELDMLPAQLGHPLHRRGRAIGEVVDDGHFVAGEEQLDAGVRPDVASAAGDENRGHQPMVSRLRSPTCRRRRRGRDRPVASPACFPTFSPRTFYGDRSRPPATARRGLTSTRRFRTLRGRRSGMVGRRVLGEVRTSAVHS